MFHPLYNSMIPFNKATCQHGEFNYAPEQLRQRRARLYILTDKPGIVDAQFAGETDGIICDLKDFSDRQIADGAFYIYFSRTAYALPMLRRIIDCGGLFAPPLLCAKAPFAAVSEKALDTYNEVGGLIGNEPYGGIEIHTQICQAIELTKDVRGDFVEVGVYTGSSALTALTHMRNIGIQRRCWLLDTFAGFNYSASEESADIIWTGTHKNDPYDIVNLRAINMERIGELFKNTGQEVHLVPSNICSDPLPREIDRIAIANVDCDLYEAVLASLQKIGPRMAHRGIIIAEDPTATPALYGAFLAMKEFLQSGAGKDFMGVQTTTQYYLIKVQN